MYSLLPLLVRDGQLWQAAALTTLWSVGPAPAGPAPVGRPEKQCMTVYW